MNELCVLPDSICVVAFTTTELKTISEKLKKELNVDSKFINDTNFDFNKNKDKSYIKLSTVRDIKGIDCPIVIFMVSDQSKSENHGGIKDSNRANAIYTVITRAMYLLQVFIPDSSKNSDKTVAAIVRAFESYKAKKKKIILVRKRKFINQ